MLTLINNFEPTSIIAFVLTYLLHSSVWVLLVTGLVRLPGFNSVRLTNHLWKAAFIGGLMTSLFCFELFAIELSPASEKQFISENISPENTGTEELLFVDKNKPELNEIKEIYSEPKTKHSFSFSINAIFSGLVIFWICVVLIKLLAAFFQHILYFKKIKNRPLINHPTVLQIFQNLQKKAQLRHPIIFSQSAELDAPILIRNREICLPEKAVTEMDAQQMEAMLAHELAHIVRKDYYWNCLLLLWNTIFFFQPLHQWAVKKINATNELLCDEWAAKVTGNNLALANCLVTVAGWMKKHPVRYALVAGMSVQKSELNHRIQSLIKLPDMKKERFNFLKLSLVFILFLTTLFLVLPGFTFSKAVIHESGTSNCAELLRAVKKNDIEKVRKLAANSDVNCEFRKEGEPRSPLNAAARKGYLEIGKILLAAGADVEYRTTGDEGALMGAARYGHLDFVKLMIENGANINRQVNGDGTALINAVRDGHYEVAKYLLENGADPEQNSPGDENPIYHASQHSKRMLNLVMSYMEKE
ncbi:MAG: M56 family metallopeptidase [Bacteroidota bacterium]